jgi:hypothetical protein
MKISNSDEQRNRPGDRLASHRARRLTHARRSSKCFGGRVPRAQPWGESWTCGAGTSSVRFRVAAHFDRQDIGVHDTDTPRGLLPDNAEHFLGIRGPAQETLQQRGVLVVSHVKDFKPAQDGPPGASGLVPEDSQAKPFILPDCPPQNTPALGSDLVNCIVWSEVHPNPFPASQAGQPQQESSPPVESAAFPIANAFSFPEGAVTYDGAVRGALLIGRRFIHPSVAAGEDALNVPPKFRQSHVLAVLGQESGCHARSPLLEWGFPNFPSSGVKSVAGNR